MRRAAALWCAAIVLGALPAYAAVEPTVQQAEKFRYNGKGRRDPFVLLVRDGRIVAVTGSGHESSQPVLYGVLWDPGGNSIALINNGEARVGDAIGEYKVLEIRKDSVVLANGGEPIILEIAFEQAPKSPSGAVTGGRQP